MYCEKVVRYLELNKKNKPDDPDIRKIVDTLMREQIWSIDRAEMKAMRIPQFDMQNVIKSGKEEAVEMFSLKKHLQDVPQFKDKVISYLSRCDYENFKTSEFATQKLNKKPTTCQFIKKEADEHVIQTKKQVAQKAAEMHFNNLNHEY